MSHTNPIVGRHRGRIGPMQQPSAETIEYANNLNWHVLGPGEPAVSEWAALGLEQPNLPVLRQYRLNRVREMLRKFDYAGIVVFDPLNIRYATDSTNMQVWILHNANRYCFIPTEGPVILFDYHGAEHLSDHLDLIDEIRIATPWYYFAAGSRYAEKAEQWAAEIADLVKTYGGGNNRIAIDHCNPEGLVALNSHGILVHNGQEVMELARSIKSKEDIKAMRCAIAACDKAIDVMKDAMKPGITEQRLWSYLHAENIARGGEWIETRLLASGPRTVPWFQEASSRVIEEGDIMAFDTDLIGPYGICVDISRTWLCGSDKPTPKQKETYQLAYQQIMGNTEMLRPGMTFKEMVDNSYFPSKEKYHHYSVLYHGVGLADEYPAICFPHEWEDAGYDGILEPGMVICVESYVGPKDGGEGVKLENQVLITENGPKTLSHYPFEEMFLS